jgi:hypothetical protein
LGNNKQPNNVIRAPPLTKVKVDGSVKTARRNNVKQPSRKLPTDVRDNYDTPILFPDSYFPSRNLHVQNTNAWFDGDGVEQRMLLPRGYSIPEELYGSNYVWDTKGWPKLINTTPKPTYNRMKGSTRNKVSYDSPMIFPDHPSYPLHTSDSYFPSRNLHVQNTNAWFDGDFVEQRMLLPRGYSIPEEVYGPNYIWDTKGWPRLINTTPKPTYNRMKGSARNKVSYDSPIIFPDDPSYPLHTSDTDYPQIHKQNDYKIKSIEK